MKAIILYKPDSEFARVVEEFEHEFSRRTPYTIELVDVDSLAGIAQAGLYDVVEYPTVAVIRDDKQLVKSWSGIPLPLVNDVAGYLVEQ